MMPGAAELTGEVYGAALMATLPLLVALGASRGIRRLDAAAQARLWQAGVVVMLAAAFGRLLPGHWLAWVLPETLAAPLVAFGRAPLQLEVGYGRSDVWASWVAAVYLVGVGGVLLQVVGGRWRLARVARGAVAVPTQWMSELERARVVCGVERPVRLLVTDAVVSPMTWGIWRPVLILSAEAHRWTSEQRYLAILHEMLHVRANDSAWALAGRIMRAVFWFHPGAWWLEARLRETEEQRCDDLVLLSGVTRSAYAELLVDASGARLEPAACSLGSGGLRMRLRRIVDEARVPRDVTPPVARGILLLGATLSMVVATGHLAPTRAVLTTLVGDSRWETRAYAVRRLAQRRDSLVMARQVAHNDPHPGVRAVAQLALTRTPMAAVGDTLIFVRD